jgi:heterodisulfide reductase subunit C
VQLGEIDKAAASEAIWKCVSCLTCSTRCPKEVDCAGILDALRQLAAKRNLAAPAGRRTLIFMEEFLRNIRRNGRLNELELIGAFKTRAFLTDASIPFLFKDATLAPKLRARGKFHLRGEQAADRGVVERIFARCEEKRGGT